ncbi:MAG: tRNA uracil 4-sulfurtransferase ThiI [Candidatus Wallacebacter cryptica]
MYHTILLKYGEISLKGKNRSKFEDILIRNIKYALKDLDYGGIRKAYGRVYIDCGENWQAVVDSLKTVFGIVSFSPVLKTELDLDAIKQAANKLMAEAQGSTFKINARRPNKHFPLTSMEVNRELGGYVLQNFPEFKVDVHQPDVLLNIELRNEGAYLYHKEIPGLGGMPVGSASKGMLLLSGGIDSPAAGYLTLKRGVTLEAVHFHSYPFTSERSKQKVLDLAQILAKYAGNGEIKLWIVYFTEIQKVLQKSRYPDLNITLMRRFMLRIAERLAKREKALALITGDSLGQVASQTMESIHTINAVTNMPIFRPLIGLDKQEIVDLAKKIGTYETSILPYEDCCTVFVPKNPATKPRIDQVLEAESQFDIDALIDEAVEKTECLTITKAVTLF